MSAVMPAPAVGSNPAIVSKTGGRCCSIGMSGRYHTGSYAPRQRTVHSVDRLCGWYINDCRIHSAAPARVAHAFDSRHLARNVPRRLCWPSAVDVLWDSASLKADDPRQQPDAGACLVNLDLEGPLRTNVTWCARPHACLPV